MPYSARRFIRYAVLAFLLIAACLNHRSITKTIAASPVASVIITSPANGAVFSFPGKIMISADPGNSPVGYINFYANNGLIGTASSIPYTFTWVDGTPGNYSLTAEIVELSGNRTISNAVSISINGNCSPAWSNFTIPPSTFFLNDIRGIDAISANEVWAVGRGRFESLASSRALAAKWNGTQWIPTGFPLRGDGAFESMTHVEAINPNSVWAFGEAASSITNYRWDGNVWSAVPFANLAGYNNPRIGDVSGSSPNNLWVVGNDSQVIWTARWNGSGWSRIQTPLVRGALNGVAAISENDVWAVGAGSSLQGRSQLLILHWDGARWNIVAGEESDAGGGNPIGNGALTAISARAANDIWAVGYDLEYGARPSIALHWDGRQWSEFLLPQPYARGYGKLNKVIALAPDDVWAVGYFTTTTTSTRPVAYHWDGERWSLVYTPDSGDSNYQEFLDITATSPADVWAAGKGSVNAPLSERYLVPCQSGGQNSPGLLPPSIENTSPVGGATVLATINLTEPAPAGGRTISLASNQAAVSVPNTVTVPAGAQSANFEINTAPVTATEETLITLSMNGMLQRARLFLQPTGVNSVSFDPPSVVNGGSSRMTVSLDGPAPAGGAVISLRNYEQNFIPLPAELTIPAGQTSVSLNIENIRYHDGIFFSVRATFGALEAGGFLTVSSGLGLASLYALPAPFATQDGVNIQLRLTGPAPAGGAVVELNSGNPALVTVPQTVIVPEGKTETIFAIVTQAAPAPVSVEIRAAWNNTSVRESVTLSDYKITSFQLDKDSALAGQSVQATVALNKPAGAPGVPVLLFSSNQNAAFPAQNIVIPAGAISARVTFLPLPVKAAETTKLFAAINTDALSDTLTVQPAIAPSIRFDPPVAAGASPARGTITLAAPAPAGGAIINLFSSDPLLALPPQTVTIPEGATTASFNVATSNVDREATVTVWASYLGAAKRAKLTISPLTIASFTLEPASVLSTQSTQATITLTGALPLTPYNFTIVNDKPSVAFAPRNVLMPIGLTSVTFNIQTLVVTQRTEVIFSVSFGAVTKTATLTVSPDVVRVTSVEYSSFRRQLRVEARSTSSSASLGVYVTSGNRLIGYLTNNGGGRYSALFNNVANPQSITVRSNLGGSAVWSLTGAPPPPPPPPPVILSLLLIEPVSVNNGSNAQGTVTLSDVAPAGGASVALSSNNAAAVVDESVLVPAGSNSVTFPIATRTVTAPAVVTISASYGGLTRTASITVLPVVQAGDAVTIQTASYDFFHKQLTVQATSTNPAARLQVFVTSTNQLIGTMTSAGSGRFSGQFFSPSNPQNITVKSSLGGSTTRIVR